MGYVIFLDVSCQAFTGASLNKALLPNGTLWTEWLQQQTFRYLLLKAERAETAYILHC